MSTSPENRDVIERRERLARARAARARRNPGVGLLLISFGVATWTVIALAFLVLSLEGVNVNNVARVVGPLVVVVSLALVTRGRRERVGGAERAVAADARAPIVYLRPFGADSAQIANRMSSRVRISPRASVEKTYEERLARALRKIGPFIAVGDPAERLPLLGAARLYAADEDWQATVGELIGRAGVVLLHAGQGGGFTWEVGHVIEHGVPERTILSLPLDAKRRQPSRQERYDAFRNQYNDFFPRPLPEAIGHCQFAYFDAEWTPRLLGERGAPIPDGESERGRALRSLAREFKVTWGPQWARLVVYSIPVLVLLWGIGTFMGAAH
jgi:hypothetical protein